LPKNIPYPIEVPNEV